MKLLVTILGSLLLLTIVAFCVFGFMASFEDRTAEFIAFRIGYGVIGVGCLVGVGLLIFRAMSQRNDRKP